MFFALGNPRRRMVTGALFGALVVFLPPTARAETTWLATRGRIPALRADPREPRSSLTWYAADDHLAAALGGRYSLVDVGDPEQGWALAVEGGVTLDFGIDGTFFPVETLDGLIGLRAELSQGVARAVFRIRHVSAHQADGDSTVSYRARTVSREFWSLEIGAAPGSFYAYARAGASWHSVPAEHDPNLALGLEWAPPGPAWRPVAALYWGNDGASGQRSQWSTFTGVETGRAQPLRLGLRWFHGPGPSGQQDDRVVDRWGLEIQLNPQAPSIPRPGSRTTPPG